MGLSGFGDPRRRFPSLNRTISTAANAVVAMAFAPACASCAAVLDEPLAGPVCETCWTSIPPFALSWRPGDASAIDAAMAAAAYDSSLRDIIHAWKFEGRQQLARRLGAVTRERCAAVIDGAELAVPVPMTPWRRWRRGFNQAVDLARHLGVPVAHPLARWRPRPAQASLPSHLRKRNLSGSVFVVPSRRAAVRGRIVLLVDDVVTTGATLEACAVALKGAGAKEVRAVTAARTLLRSADGSGRG